MGSGHQPSRQSEENLNRVRRLLGWTDAERRDSVRVGSLPHRNLQPGEFVLFVPYLYCGLGVPISSFFMLLLEKHGLQLQHLTPHSILHAAIFAHVCEMFVGVPPCVTLFRHFFSVRCSGRCPTEIGRYYFLLKGSGGRSTYLPTFASAKWEHWRNDWVIIRAEPNDRLALPDSGPVVASLPEWSATTDLPPEFSPVLARITELVNSGLTSMHVLADYLRRRLAPLQMRPRLAWGYTSPNDCSRVVRGEDHDLSQPLLEEWVRRVTDESFSPEQLRLPSAIVPLCRDQALRTSVLREMPMLDDGGLAVRQLGGDPNRGVHIDDAPVGGSGTIGTTPTDKGKRPVAASPVVSPAGGEEARRRLVRGDGTFVSEPDPKRQRTSGEGSSSGQGRGVPTPPHPDQRQPQQRTPPPMPDQQRRAPPAPPASGQQQQQRPAPQATGEQQRQQPAPQATGQQRRQQPAPQAMGQQPRRGSGLRGRWTPHIPRSTRPVGAFPPSGSGSPANTAEKCAPGGPTAGDASRARTPTEGPAPGAAPSAQPRVPGGLMPGGATGAEAAPREPAGRAVPDAQSQAPGGPMSEGVAAQGPVPRAASDARPSEPSSPGARMAGSRSPPPAEGELEERLVNRERAVGVREKQVEVGEAQLKLDRAKLESAQKGMEQRRQELVEVSERQAAISAGLDKVKSGLVEREAAVKAREDSVAQREAAAKTLKESATG
ncbi:hypothetical protein BS78_01G315200 [Paspalum vaginatum]|nr:hypothetical protein BS78_01G315200 [Paspalum vaginatum]